MHTYNSLSGILANNEHVCPSVGDVNLLVIPVHLPGSEEYKTEQVRNDIKEMFFGEESSRNGFVSVKECYKESSFGKLNFSGTVTDWFDVETYTNVKSVSEITQGNTGTIVTEILRKAQENPSEYQTLAVRVSGWNARFVTLDKQWQDMVIAQNERK
jgi:autonomous glycyl radical cofactor GrcA